MDAVAAIVILGSHRLPAASQQRGWEKEAAFTPQVGRWEESRPVLSSAPWRGMVAGWEGAMERGKLEELVAKLLRETERLRNDVGVLAGRIEPFENEQRALLPRASKDTPVDWSWLRTDKDVLATIAEARTGIRSCEYALTAMRGSLEAIAADAVSREEWKPYIRPPPRRGG